jgi:hypothetical protein
MTRPLQTDLCSALRHVALAVMIASAPAWAAAQDNNLTLDDGTGDFTGDALGDGTGFAPQPVARPAGQEVASAPGAELRALDKVTGQSTDLAVRDGETVRFGRLGVRVTECRYPVADQSSNAFAHVVITETEGRPPIFDAWMVATSPALSALDHPRYDVWVMRCMSS